MIIPTSRARVRPWWIVSAAAALVVATAGVAKAQNPDHPGHRYATVGASWMAGEYIVTSLGSDGYVATHRAHTFQEFGASLAWRTELGWSSLAIRAQGYRGIDNGRERTRESGYLNVNPAKPSDAPFDRSISAGSLVATVDFRYVGVTGGVTAGTLGLPSFDEAGAALERTKPVLGIRVGLLSRAYAEFSRYDHEPGPSPAPILSMGVGFYDNGGRRYRLGMGENGAYGEIRFLTGRGIEIEPFIASGTLDGGFITSLRVAKRIGTW